MIYGIMIMSTLIAFCSLAVDYGRVVVAKQELRVAADAAARYAVTRISSGVSTVRSAAIAAAADNQCDGQSVTLTNSDIEFGTWDSTSATFTAVPAGQETTANALRITAGRLASRGTGVPMYFARVVGIRSCDVRATVVSMYRAASSTGQVAGVNSVSLTGSTAIDSYNSSTGSYAVTASTNGDVASNGNISLSGSAKIYGDATPGPGSSVSTTGSASVTGSKTPAGSSVSYDYVDSSTAASSNNNASIPSSYINGNRDVSLGGNGSLTLSSGTYYVRNFTMGGGSSLTISGNVTMYVTGNFSMGGGSSMNTISPSQFKVRVDGSGTVHLTGSASLYADVYAPESAITLQGSSDLYGAAVGATLTLSGSSSIHLDQAISSGTSSSGTVLTVK
jgi:hypothetical protein